MDRSEAMLLVDQITDLLTGISYPDWCRIKYGVERAFSEKRNKVKADDPERLKQLIGSQFS